MNEKEFKQLLKSHNFNSYCEFLDLVGIDQKLTPDVKYSLLKKEYDESIRNAKENEEEDEKTKTD